MPSYREIVGVESASIIPISNLNERYLTRKCKELSGNNYRLILDKCETNSLAMWVKFGTSNIIFYQNELPIYSHTLYHEIAHLKTMYSIYDYNKGLSEEEYLTLFEFEAESVALYDAIKKGDKKMAIDMIYTVFIDYDFLHENDPHKKSRNLLIKDNHYRSLVKKLIPNINPIYYYATRIKQMIWLNTK